MYVIGLAPSHPLRTNNQQRVTKVSFDAGKRTLDSFRVSGKKKNAAIKVNCDTTICKLYYTQNNGKQQSKNEDNGDEEHYAFRPLFYNAKIIEVNKRLIDNPQLITDNADIEGWIAICESSHYQWSGRKDKYGKKRKIKHIEDDLLNEKQYRDYIAKSNLNVPGF